MLKFDHLRLPVTDLARSRDWYIRTLGLRVEFELPERQTVALQDTDDFTILLQEVLTDVVFNEHRGRIAELAAKGRLPAVYGLPEHVEAGGLMAYCASRAELFRRAATYVDKILKGAKPADLPIEQPTRFELIVNLRTARALGITIPASILVRADRVIE